MGLTGSSCPCSKSSADENQSQGLVVFARAATPAGPFKNGPGVIGSPVAVGGVVVSPGDLIVADTDGVVVPHHRAGWAADQVDPVIEKEEALRRRIVAARG